MTNTLSVIDTLNKHVTVRFFTGEPVSDEMLHTILNAARRSPTSSNMQTYSIVVVRDAEKKKKLAEYAGNQKHIETCDVFVAFCADLRRLETAAEMHGEVLAKNLEISLVSTVDAALVGMSVQLAAESCGLGAVMVGGMRNYPEEVAKLLGFPSGVFVVYGMSIGWPDWNKVPPQKPRLAEELIIHHEAYNDADPRELLQQYDGALADYYGRQDRNQHEAAWTGPIAKRLNTPRRPQLREQLTRLGFPFE